MAMESWWPQPAWLSSGAALFLLFNALVGAVVVMSRGQRGGRGRRLCRSASSMVLDRLRSFSSMFSLHPAAAEYYYHTTTSEAGEEPRVDEAAAAPPENGAAEPPSAPAAACGAVASREAEEKCPGLEERNAEGRQQHHANAEPSSPPAASAAGDASSAGDKGAHKEQPAKEAAPAESSCKRRARACRREAEVLLMEGKAELNARAELFINQFREELKLQRLNSIVNYARGIRGRAAGAALLPQD